MPQPSLGVDAAGQTVGLGRSRQRLDEVGPFQGPQLAGRPGRDGGVAGLVEEQSDLAEEIPWAQLGQGSLTAADAEDTPLHDVEAIPDLPLGDDALSGVDDAARRSVMRRSRRETCIWEMPTWAAIWSWLSSSK